MGAVYSAKMFLLDVLLKQPKLYNFILNMEEGCRFVRNGNINVLLPSYSQLLTGKQPENIVIKVPPAPLSIMHRIFDQSACVSFWLHLYSLLCLCKKPIKFSLRYVLRNFVTYTGLFFIPYFKLAKYPSLTRREMASCPYYEEHFKCTPTLFHCPDVQYLSFYGIQSASHISPHKHLQLKQFTDVLYHRYFDINYAMLHEIPHFWFYYC